MDYLKLVQILKVKKIPNCSRTRHFRELREEVLVTFFKLICSLLLIFCKLDGISGTRNCVTCDFAEHYLRLVTTEGFLLHVLDHVKHRVERRAIIDAIDLIFQLRAQLVKFLARLHLGRHPLLLVSVRQLLTDQTRSLLHLLLGGLLHLLPILSL